MYMCVCVYVRAKPYPSSSALSWPPNAFVCVIIFDRCWRENRWVRGRCAASCSSYVLSSRHPDYPPQCNFFLTWKADVKSCLVQTILCAVFMNICTDTYFMKRIFVLRWAESFVLNKFSGGGANPICSRFLTLSKCLCGIVSMPNMVSTFL